MVAKYGKLKVGDVVSLNWSSNEHSLWIIESIDDRNEALMVTASHDGVGVRKLWRNLDLISFYFRIIEV